MQTAVVFIGGFATAVWLFVWWPAFLPALVLFAGLGYFQTRAYTHLVMDVTQTQCMANLEAKAVKSLAEHTVQKVVSSAPYN